MSSVLRDAANLSVILGVVFAVVQLTMTSRIERVRLAIEASAPTQSKDFLESYSKLIDAYQADHDMVGSESLRDDLLYVMNVYDGVSVQYLNGLLQNDIVERRLFNGMDSMTPVLDAMRWPESNRINFDAARLRMRSHLANENQHTP